MGTYTLELTFDELKIVSRALTREVDRLDDLGDPKLNDVEPLENRVHDIYMNARRVMNMNERAWINAERDRV